MRRGRALFAAGALAVLAAALALAWLVLARRGRVEREARARTEQVSAGPRVLVARVTSSAAHATLHLQGEARPYALVTLYAKLSGYLREVRVDKGDLVKAGQVLAVLEAPELNRQYSAARADASNLRTIARRNVLLARSDFVSTQDAQVAVTNARIAAENARALRSQRGYEILRAPFDGVVVARYADPGALMQAATGAQTGALPVVAVAQTRHVRIYVYLEQRDAARVRVGDAGQIAAPEHPGRPLRATVTRLSGQLDPRTRTMLVELDFDNRGGELLAGGFVDVALTIEREPRAEVPSEALVLRGEQPFLAMVGDDQRVRYRAVKLAEDDGIRAQLLEGAKVGERVAIGLGEGVGEGGRVQAVERK